VDWDVASTNPVRVVGANYVVEDDIRATNRFYRLIKPVTPTDPQQPGPSAVTIGRLDATRLQISWPTTLSGYRLQYADGGLANWREWDTIAAPVVETGQNYVTTDTIGPNARFYRLIAP
jgi:hypothetical protein